MNTAAHLSQSLRQLDGKSYPAYKDLRGGYRFADFELWIDHVQGDPFAAPSRCCIRLSHDFPDWTTENASRRRALCDYLHRHFAASCRRLSKGERVSGKSGAIAIAPLGQEILERSAVVIKGGHLEVRFQVGLPAFGRRIAGQQASAILLEEIPAIVADSLWHGAQNAQRLREHLLTCEDADALRLLLPGLRCVAFVADGALLPRASGVDDRPLRGGLPFQSPLSLRRTVELPNRQLSGMAIPEGITLIVGGGFHGKSTLLRAIERGVYNHLPGDGREFVVSRAEAVKIRAEDGRFVKQTDISAFIGALPGGQDTTRFSTENASGSTSQAANVVEAIEAGAQVLLIDEDTSATNFMIRDQRMQHLVQQEPITSFVDRVQALYTQHGISSLLVIGGSGLYLDVAHTVIGLSAYRPEDLSARAREVARHIPAPREVAAHSPLALPVPRMPLPASFDAFKGGREKTRAFDTRSLQFGETEIDLSAVEQLVEQGQLNAIAAAMLYAREHCAGHSLPELLDALEYLIDTQGLDALRPQRTGSLATFRRFELAAAINRLRALEIR
jgi:predicted ABC-class ATPase